MKIYKYELDLLKLNKEQIVMLPFLGGKWTNYQFLYDIQFQKDKLVCWAPYEEGLFPTKVWIAFTGSDTPDMNVFDHVKTIQKTGFVFHIFINQEIP